jgi:hypothetical protein
LKATLLRLQPKVLSQLMHPHQRQHQLKQPQQVLQNLKLQLLPTPHQRRTRLLLLNQHLQLQNKRNKQPPL